MASAVRAPPGPADPGALESSLARTESAIYDPATPSSSLPRLGAREQVDIGALAGHPAWLFWVLAALPARVRPRVEADVAADAALASISSPPAAGLPPWRILQPEPPAVLVSYYRSTEERTGVPWYVLAAVHLVETRMGRIRGPSSAGAEGPMQFLPSTWATYGDGGDIWSNRDSIAAAGRFLEHYGGRDDLAGALHHYNPSSAYVTAVLQYASVMKEGERAYDAYYGWQVYVSSTSGDWLLPEGFKGPGSS